MNSDKYVKRKHQRMYQPSAGWDSHANRTNKGLIQLLLSCPVKGWFKPSSELRPPNKFER